MQGFLQLDWTNVRSAVVYGLLTMLVAGLDYVLKLGDTSLIHIHDLTNVMVLAGGVFFISLLKNLLTTSSGKFLGSVQVTPPKQ